MKTILCLFLLIPFSSGASDWTREDTYREATYLTLHTIDWAQTRNIARNPLYYEQNAILGKHPSVGKVDGYFVLTGLAHIAISYYLPTEYRKAFQYITLGIEGGAVAHNISLGIGVKF